MRLDRHERLAFLPLEDPLAASLLASLTEDERLASWRLARTDGSLAGYLGVRGRAPDAVYRFIAERREFLGRLVLDGVAPRRYP